MLLRSRQRTQVAGILRWAVLAYCVTGLTAVAQQQPVHWLHAGAMPPGAIGGLRLQRGGPVSGYYQPVRIRAPEGARIALARESSHAAVGDYRETLVGLQIGPVYRFRVADIPDMPEVEIFPTIEVVDRLYPPPGKALRYPIPVEVTRDEIELAASGAFVTRVIYVEDPLQALPVKQSRDSEQRWIEAPRGDDPLIMADRLGRAVAILRMGNRVPSTTNVDGAADCDAPPAMVYDAINETPRDCPDASSLTPLPTLKENRIDGAGTE